MKKIKIEGFIYNKNVNIIVKINQYLAVKSDIYNVKHKLIYINFFAGSLVILKEKVRHGKINFKLNIFEFKRKFPTYIIIEIENGYMLIIKTKFNYIIRLIYNSKCYFDKGYIKNNLFYGTKLDFKFDFSECDKKQINEYHKGLIQKTYFINGSSKLKINFLNDKNIIELKNLKTCVFYRGYN